MRISVIVILLSSIFLASPSLCADSPSAPSAVAGPKRAAFDKVFTQWKQHLAEMAALRQKHVAADREDRLELEKRYAEMIAQGEKLHAQLIKAAVEAYPEAPDVYVDLELFLGTRVRQRLAVDDFEETYQLAKLLIDNGSKEKRLYLWGGVAAFCIGELDTAEQWLMTAEKKGVSLRSDKGDPLDPTIFVFHEDPRPFKAAWEKEKKIRAQEAEADNLPRVLIRTTKGDIVVELFENEAPNTVANFLALVKQGYYDGLPFHRVLEGFMAQGGDNGRGGPGYTIACECHQPNHRKHFRGSLSMAHAGRDTGAAQFFLTFIPTTHLDGAHTVFGRVIKGMDVLSKLQRRNPDDVKEGVAAPDEIIEAKVLRARPHKYEVKKIEKP